MISAWLARTFAHSLALSRAFRRLSILVFVSPLAAAVHLKPGVPIVLPSDAPASVRLAVKDLQRDLQKVFGKPSPVVSDAKTLEKGGAIVILVNSGAQSHLHDEKVAGLESHGIHVGEWEGQSCVVLEGADPRGAIYAIYTFSDVFLDIPPLWYWCEWVPKRRDEIAISTDTRLWFPQASVRWRAWLNNDADFLTPWREHSAENDHAMFETLLRLKYNTLEVGSIADFKPGAPKFAVQTEVAEAHARGLVITHHHTSPLGSNLSSWNVFWEREHQRVPLSVQNPEALKAFWRYHVETAKRAGLEVVWTVVFRGSRDIPFWETFEDAPPETEKRAQVLNAMLQAEVDVVKEVTGEKAPNLRTTFYNEGTTLLTAGLLHPPEDPTLIWNFVAARRDHFPTDFIRHFKAPPGRLLGYYLNFQFTSTGSHLAPAEGPWKMAENYRVVQRAGSSPLAFTVVNAGNAREHLTELAANADMMWRFNTFDANHFLENFCSRYFGASMADEVSKLYRDYYDAFWNQKASDIPNFERQYIFQDMRYARAVEMLVKDMAENVFRPDPLEGHPLDNPNTGSVGYFRVELTPGDADQTDALLRGATESRRKFLAVVEKASGLLPSLGQGDVYFHDNLLARAKVMVALNELLRETTLAYRSHLLPSERRLHLKAALAAADAVKSALDETKHGVFATWYDSDRVFGLSPIRASLQQLLDRSKE